MRQHLYKAKRIDNGEWVYGYYYKTHTDEHEIGWYDNKFDIERMTAIVDPETVCEYTGCSDINGNKIFENDIINCQVIRNGGTYSNWEQERNINHGKCRTIPMKVVYRKYGYFYNALNSFALDLTEEAKRLIVEYEKPIGQERVKQHINYYNIREEDLLEVIGNAFDHPELLDKGE